MKNTCYETFNRSAVEKGNLSITTGVHPELFTLNRSAVNNPTLTKYFSTPLYPGATYSYFHINHNRYS